MEDFSSIMVFDDNDILIAEGWMNFIHEKERDLFIAYWDLLDLYDVEGMNSVKDSFGIPQHILNRLPIDLITKYINN